MKKNSDNKQSFEKYATNAKTLLQNYSSSTILIAIFTIQLAGFSFYTYYNFSQQVSPEGLKRLAEKSVHKNYGKVRKAIQQELIKEAPHIAKKLSKKAIASAPEARERLEQLVKKYFDEGLESGTELSAIKFRNFVQANKDDIRERYKQLDKLPEASTEYIIHLEKSLDHYLGTEIRANAKTTLATQQTLNDHLERLLWAPNLKVVELLEVRMLRTARTIQLKEVGKLELPSSPLKEMTKKEN